MKSHLPEFISKLKKLIAGDSKYVSKISHPFELISALTELSGVVGLDKIKNSVILQIKSVMVNDALREKKAPPRSGGAPLKKSQERNLLDGHYLNIVLSGPPGCGKTSIGYLLCKVYSSLGVIRQPSRGVIDLRKDEISKLPPIKPKRIETTEQEITSLLSQDPIIINWDKISKAVQKIEGVARDTKSYRHRKVLFECRDDFVIELNGLTSDTEFYTKDQLLSSIQRVLRFVKERSFSFPPLPEIKEETPKKEYAPKFKVLKRKDLVAEYVGQTAIKTEAALVSALGGVILIDEAYELFNTTSGEDPFGMEALTSINQFLSLHTNEIMIIFSGYKELMDKTIFRVQPGLRSRIGFVFEFTPYTGMELGLIFEEQLLSRGWEILAEDRDKILSLFEDRKECFPFFGRDTERLVKSCVELVIECSFDDLVDKEILPSGKIDFSTVREALTIFQHSLIKKEENSPPLGMYT